MKMAIVAAPYDVHSWRIGRAAGPDAIIESGLMDELSALGHTITTVAHVELTEEEKQQYGGWNRVGSAGAHLARLVADARKDGSFVLGLLSDCNSVLGVLGGLQQGERRNWPRRVGLVWIDAHGDYNTPETSPSGLLGGMPVAIAAGKALHRLRKQNMVRVPLQSPDLLMVGLRDLDELERQALARDEVMVLSEKDLIDCSPALIDAMEQLSQREDIIYVHVDLDILDPVLAPAAGLPSPGGLTGKQLGKSLATLLSFPKVQALAFASYNSDEDEDKKTLKEVLDAISGAFGSDKSMSR